MSEQPGKTYEELAALQLGKNITLKCCSCQSYEAEIKRLRQRIEKDLKYFRLTGKETMAILCEQALNPQPEGGK